MTSNIINMSDYLVLPHAEWARCDEVAVKYATMITNEPGIEHTTHCVIAATMMLGRMIHALRVMDEEAADDLTEIAIEMITDGPQEV